MSLFEKVIKDLMGLYDNLTLNDDGTTATKGITVTENLLVFENIDPAEWEVVNVNTKEKKFVKDISGATKLIVLEFVSAFKDFMKEEEHNAPIENLKDGGFEIPETNEPEELTPEEKLAKLDEIMDGEIEPPKSASHSIVTKPEQKPTSSVLQVYNYSTKQLQAIKDTVAKGASDSEFEMLMYLANRYQLDPILKEIFYSSQMKTIMTSRDGYLKIAHRDPAFKGMQSMAVCENDDFELDVVNCSVKHKFGKGDRGKVIGAWAIVYKEGMKPQLAWAATPEYKNNNPAWKYVSAMSCKCAENFALKRAFSISGLVTQEEFGMEDHEISGTVPIIDAEYMEVEA